MAYIFENIPNDLSLKKFSENFNVPKHKKGEKFLKGPIPWKWITKAGKQSGKALQLAIHIWHLAGMKNSKTITINLSRLNIDWDINRITASRSLKALENSGLVKVQRLPGQKPVVTILEV